MKKTNKIISILIAVAMLLTMAPLSLTANAAPDQGASEPYANENYIYGDSAILAKGTPITIEEGTNGTTSVWYTDGGTKKYLKQNADLSDWLIFAGSNNPEGMNCDGYITMTGGTVKNICAGQYSGYFNGTSNIVITGGTITDCIFCCAPYVITDDRDDIKTVTIFDSTGATINTGDYGVADNVVQKKNGVWNVSGNGVVPSGVTLNVEQGETLNVPEDATLTNNGSVVVNGTATVRGKLIGNAPQNYVKPEAFSISETTLNANVPYKFTPVVSPSNCTLTPWFTYSVAEGSAASATVTEDTVTPHGAGKLTLLVAVNDGYSTPVEQEVQFDVNFTPVTAVNGVPSEGWVNASVALPASASPADASYTDIVWSVVNDNSTGAVITGNTIKAKNAGTATVRATVSNGTAYGTDYIKDFNITFKASAVVDFSVNSSLVTIAEKDADTVTVNWEGFSGGSRDFGTDEPITITGSYSGGKRQGFIVDITSGKPLIVLDNLNLTSTIYQSGVFAIRAGAAVSMELVGENTLNTNNSIECASIEVYQGSTLVINGEGTLNTVNSKYGINIGGSWYGGKNTGTITINGGTIVTNSKIGAYSTDHNGTVVINGGNIICQKVEGTLQDGNGNSLALKTITLNGATQGTKVTEVEGFDYGVTGVKTIDTNKLYFYLPETPAVSSITAGGTEYICNRSLTYYAAHDWSAKDGVCACGLICEHPTATENICDICGESLHIHSFEYTAGANGRIVATCVADDCTLENGIGGTLTISAPADLYTDGTTAKEAVIDNQLVEAADYTVTYSTADGSAPKTAGTYTASVTVGGATATVEFTLLNYAAKVTDKDGNLIGNYKTLADAVTAAQENENSTLALLNDITVSKELDIESGKFTLDLNGKNLVSERGRVIESYAVLTIKDSGEGGTIYGKGGGGRAIINRGTLTFESGTVKGDGGIENRGTLTFNNGTVEAGDYSAISNYNMVYVYDGVFRSTKSSGINNYGTAFVYDGESSGVLNEGAAYISGGKFVRNSYAALNLNGGTVEITGGSFSGTDKEDGIFTGVPYSEFTVILSDGATLTLKGGEFPNGFTVYGTTANTLLADGYHFRDADGKVINMADDAKVINGYVKVTKGADLSEAVVTIDDSNLTYTGEEIIPTVAVKVSGKTLTEGKDYTLTFANNINAGTATVTVKAVGQVAGGIVGGGNSNAGNSVESVYTGEITKEFTILKADSSIDVDPEANELTYNGEAQTLVVLGDTYDGMIVYSLDGEKYSPVSPTGTNAGEYTVYYKVEGDSNHNDSEPETVTVTIGKKPVIVSATVPDRIYGDDYQVDTSKVVVTFDGVVDGDNVGYVVIDAYYHMHTVTDSALVHVVYNVNGADAGNYQFPEYGDWMAPNYGVQATGKVLPRDIADAKITLGDVLIYNGAEQTQSIASVTIIGKDVTYTVSGNTATNVGVYELTITANTNFTGTKTVLYAINPDLSGIEGLGQYNVKSTNKADIEYVYNQLDNAETDLASAEKKAEWNEIKDECWQWLKILESVAYRVESLGSCYEKYDIDTVTSADDEALASLDAEIYLCVRDYDDNMTEEELDILDNAWVEIANLRDRIAKTKSEYDRVIAAANGYDEATVTSADKDALVKLNEDIYALALTQNVTAEEKENLQAAHDMVFGLIDKLVGISDEIKRITEKVDAYVFESVKSSDKADIQQLIADIKALLDTQNLTADERALLETADETCDKLVAKIDEKVAEIKRINNATNAYDESTVTSADKEAIEKLIADIKALTDGDNITESEREQLVADDETLDALLAKINATADEIARIEEAVNGYDEATVKSTDKADLEQLKADIKALTDSTNITEDERAKLGNLDATLDSLIKKIDDTASEIARIEEAVNSYDKETVTSADVPALGKLIDDIKALIDGDSLTDDEKAALEANDEAIDELVEKLTEVAEEIKRVDEAVKSYDENSVKSTDSEDLEQLKEDIQALIDSTNTSENEKTAFEDMIKDIEGLEDKIDETAKEIERIENAVNGYDEETVNSSDKEAINKLREDIQTLIDSSNVTEEEISGLEETKADTDALTDKIDETLAEIDRISEAVNNYKEETVKSNDKEAIEQLKEDIQTLIDSGNVTGEEIAVLENTKADADALTDKIDETENKLDEIASIGDGYDAETVTSDDKAAIEETIAEIEAVNPDSLTPEQKAEYEKIKAELNAMLVEIEKASKAVTDIAVELRKFDEDRVTIFWEEDIDDLIAKIDTLLADENMGEAEKAKLNELKDQAENLITIIKNPAEYFSMRFIYFIQDCLNRKMGGLIWLLNDIFAKAIG